MKRLLTILLCAVLVISVFSACGETVPEEQRILFVETEHTWDALCTQTGMKSHKVYTSAGNRTVAGD